MKTYAAGNKAKKAIIDIHEEFIPYNTKVLDSKNRITLGGKLKKLVNKNANVESYQVFIGRNGDILLRPMVSIPSSEAWVYKNSQVIGNVRKGLQEAKEGKTERVQNLDTFLDAL